MLSIGGGIDFGVGTTFPTYATSNIFLSAYLPAASGSLPAGSPKWSKVIQGACWGSTCGGLGLTAWAVWSSAAPSAAPWSSTTSCSRPASPWIRSRSTRSLPRSAARRRATSRPRTSGKTIYEAGNAIYTVPHNIYVQATKLEGRPVCSTCCRRRLTTPTPARASSVSRPRTRRSRITLTDNRQLHRIRSARPPRCRLLHRHRRRQGRAGLHAGPRHDRRGSGRRRRDGHVHAADGEGLD